MEIHGNQERKESQQSNTLSIEASFFCLFFSLPDERLLVHICPIIVWVRALLGKMYNQIELYGLDMCQTPLAITNCLHTDACPPGWASQPPIFSSESEIDGERDREGRVKEKREREQKENLFFFVVFKTFTKLRKCLLFISMFWSSFFIPPQWLIHMSIIQLFHVFL